MNLNEFYEKFSSDCVAGSSNQSLAVYDEPTEHTGRIAYRLSHGGENYALLFSNQLDSTFNEETISVVNAVGGTWTITSMKVGLASAWDGEPEEWHEVTFDGKKEKVVSGTEPFCSDAIGLNARSGDYLIYEIVFTGDLFPCHEEMILNVRKKDENGEWYFDKRVPAPLMIGCDRKVTKKIAFLGDSITQGIGTDFESYKHWVAKVAEGLPEEYSVWDLGIGCAMASDAATDNGWLARAKTCDVVGVCFGVNDIFHMHTPERLKNDIITVLKLLKAAGCKTILFSIPPYEMPEPYAGFWYESTALLDEIKPYADKFFDFAKVLGGKDGMAHMPYYGGHPNADGCALLAEAFLKQNLI